VGRVHRDRAWADLAVRGRKPNQLRQIEGLLWSPEAMVVREAARVLRRVGATRAEETIELVGINLGAR